MGVWKKSENINLCCSSSLTLIWYLLGAFDTNLVFQGLSSENDIEGYFIEKKVCWFWKSDLKLLRINSFLKINV